MLAIIFFITLTGNAQKSFTTEVTNALEEHVLIDFANLPPELSIDKWDIILSGYSDNPKGRILSDLKIIDVNSSKLPTEIKFDKALGIRIFYEYSYANDWAQIKPVFPISTYYAKEGEGIVRNVGPIKSISILVAGRNYKHSIEVRMVDQNGHFKSINFGSLYFNGWRTLTWVNPDYIRDKRKRDLVKLPLYPQDIPYLKFDSIVIYKSPQEPGGDFVCYVKDIRIKCEKFITVKDETIDDESIWKIQQTKAEKQKEKEEKYLDMLYSGSSKEAEYKKLKEELKQIKAQQGKSTGRK